MAAAAREAVQVRSARCHATPRHELLPSGAAHPHAAPWPSSRPRSTRRPAPRLVSIPSAPQVVVRCRPLSKDEQAKHRKIVDVDERSGQVRVAAHETSAAVEFTFDQVFGDATPQLELFRTSVEPIVRSVMEGFNGTIFAYGQTGTGVRSPASDAPKAAPPPTTPHHTPRARRQDVHDGGRAGQGPARAARRDAQRV